MTQYDIDGRFLPLLCDEITDGLKKVAAEELKETEEKKVKGIERLRDYCKKEDLPSHFDDATLLAFLRVAKFDLQKAQSRLTQYCASRRKRKDFIDRLDEKTINYILDSNILGMLPYRDMHGRFLVFGQLELWDPERCEMMDIFALFYCMWIWAFSIPACTIGGAIGIINAKTKSSSHYFTILNIYREHLAALLCFPIRIRKIDLFHINAIVHICYTALRPFLPYKLSKRVSMYKNEYTTQSCDPSILPEEFEGTMGPINNDFFKEKFMQFFEKLKLENDKF